MDNMLNVLCKIGMSIFLCLSPIYVFAALFELETTSVILEENEKSAVFMVTNSTQNPMLLVTKIQDLNPQTPLANRILISPPVARLEGNQSQFVRFDLTGNQELDHDYLLSVTFTGLDQNQVSGTVMPLSQTIGLMVESKILMRTMTPWDHLKITINEQEKIISLVNTGKQVVRLVPSITLLPSAESLSLPHMYIFSQERIDLPLPPKLKTKTTKIQLTPLSRYGVALPDTELAIEGQ